MYYSLAVTDDDLYRQHSRNNHGSLGCGCPRRQNFDYEQSDLTGNFDGHHLEWNLHLGRTRAGGLHRSGRGSRI